MDLKKTFLVNLFIILMAVSAFSVFGLSCDVSKSPKILYPSYDFYHEGKSARVTVFGEAVDGNFNSETKVIVDCNIGNKQPEPLEKQVTARIIAYTQSNLAYSSYCYYPQSSADVEYQVKASIIPDDIECTNIESSGILSKGNSVNKPALTIKPITEPVAQLPTQNKPIPPKQPKLDEEEKTDLELDKTQPPKELRFGLDWKWNLISVPFGEVINVNHECISKFYYYDKNAGKYQKVNDLKDKKLIGKGLWAKKTTGTSCTIKYTGKFLVSQTINLKKGWNLIGIQTEKPLDTTKNNNCKIVNGPFSYSGFILNGIPQGYFKRDRLDYGNGYWIKVAEDCQISNGEDEESPPALPE